MAPDATAQAVPDASPRPGTGGGRSVVRQRFDVMKHAAVSAAMGKADSWAKDVSAGNQGVLLDDYPRLLAVLNLKVVDVSRICFTRAEHEEYEAYKTIARRHLSPTPSPNEEDPE